jgi:hypothetical protein
MPPGVVVHRDKAGFQRQFGTLWRACEAYLEDKMQADQAASFETIVDPALIAAVAQTRLLAKLVEK